MPWQIKENNILSLYYYSDGLSFVLRDRATFRANKWKITMDYRCILSKYTIFRPV